MWLNAWGKFKGCCPFFAKGYSEFTSTRLSSTVISPINLASLNPLTKKRQKPGTFPSGFCRLFALTMLLPPAHFGRLSHYFILYYNINIVFIHVWEKCWSVPRLKKTAPIVGEKMFICCILLNFPALKKGWKKGCDFKWNNSVRVKQLHAASFCFQKIKKWYQIQWHL